MDTPSNTCALCKKPAGLKCSRCTNAPAYQEDDSKSTWYCSSVCQKLHWSTHKSKCKQLEERKVLERAAGILQEIMYKIRLHASPLRFQSIEFDGSTVSLKGVEFSSEGQQLGFFPGDLNDKSFPAEAVVLHAACTDALIYLHGFTMELLGETCAKIEEVVVKAINRKLRIVEIYHNRPLEPQPAPGDTHEHNVYRITLHNGDRWALDTTGAQLGYPKPLWPWEKFWCGSVIEAKLFGHFRYRVLRDDEMMADREILAKVVEMKHLLHALENAIPLMAQEHEGGLSAMLKGLGKTFMKEKDKFLGQFEVFLKGAMENLYTTQKNLRRDKEIDCRLSLNQAETSPARLGVENLGTSLFQTTPGMTGRSMGEHLPRVMRVQPGQYTNEEFERLVTGIMNGDIPVPN